MSIPRHRYSLSLPRSPSVAPAMMQFVNPVLTNTVSLAQLMFDAYQGTIDSEDETLEEAIDAVEQYFQDNPLETHSAVLMEEGVCIAACLVSYLEKQNAPLIAYIMTRRESKQTGLARLLLGDVLQKLEVAGYERVLAAITEGNEPSEKLFASYGFERMGK